MIVYQSIRGLIEFNGKHWIQRLTLSPISLWKLTFDPQNLVSTESWGAKESIAERPELSEKLSRVGYRLTNAGLVARWNQRFLHGRNPLI